MKKNFFLTSTKLITLSLGIALGLSFSSVPRAFAAPLTTVQQNLIEAFAIGQAGQKETKAKDVSLYDLVNLVNLNEAKYNQLYKGKRIGTSGMLSEIKKVKGQWRLVIAGLPVGHPAYAYFANTKANESKVANLQIGSVIKVYCEPAGKEKFGKYMAARLVKCQFPQSPKDLAKTSDAQKMIKEYTAAVQGKGPKTDRKATQAWWILTIEYLLGDTGQKQCQQVDLACGEAFMKVLGSDEIKRRWKERITPPGFEALGYTKKMLKDDPSII